MYSNLALLAGFVFLYSITSKRLERTPVNGALVYTLFGLVVGPLGLRLLDLDVDAEGLRSLAELTLALVLFTDAANSNLRVLRRSFHVPQRLLLIGLPLTIVLGIGTGLLLFGGLTLLETCILGTMLAPTDAALGKAVVSDPSVPAEMREGLNVESGLNDGICVPILFVFLTLAVESHAAGETTVLALKLVSQAIGIGVAVGVVLTYLGARALRRCIDLGWVSKTWSQLPVVALAVGCFAVAQYLGGSGFIAAFTGGLLFDRLAEKHKGDLLLAAEGTGDACALITWVVFGAAVVGQSVQYFRWDALLYALLSLTVVRMLPVFLVLHGMKLSTPEKLFMGWFGPRGLASIVFAVIVLNDKLPGGGIISITVVCTVLLSIVAHGLSANPLVAALGARLSRATR